MLPGMKQVPYLKMFCDAFNEKIHPSLLTLLTTAWLQLLTTGWIRRRAFNKFPPGFLDHLL